ncbi:C2H2 finger domain protein [Cenococcum geophilum]
MAANRKEKYIDTDSDSNSYGTEPTVFDSNTNSNADSNADNYPLEYYLKQLKEFKESNFTTQDYADGSKNLLNRIKEHYKVLQKLAKKYSLSKKKREKTVIDAEDLALVLKTNLVTIRKRYIVGQHQMQVTLICDLEGGPYKIVLKFIFEFTKEYLGIKEANTFLIPKIIFNPLLILSPYLSKLYIKPRRNKLPLLLRLDLDNIPVFWRLIKNPYGYKDLSVITGFYLRYGAGKAFNKNSNHTDARIFLKHYLLRRVSNPRIYTLIKIRNKLKLSLKRKTAGSIEYQKLSREITNERQPVINIKRQLSGDKFSEDIKVTLEFTIITLPSVRNNAINAVEGRVYWRNHHQRQSRIDIALSKVKIKEDTKILEAAKALERAKLSLYKEKRLKIYFICLGNKNLAISKRIYKFHTLATFIKHFQQTYLSKLLQ